MNLTGAIQDCLKKKRPAQQQLYSYTYTKLAAAVAVYAKDKSERDWIFNLGMMRIFSSLDKYQIDTNYLGWARTLLVRSAIDHYRTNQKHNNLTAIEPSEHHVSSDDFEKMMNSLESEVIINILQQLSEKERIVFSMYELDGYKHQEIQELTGINVNTSKWLLAKSKKSLKELILNSQTIDTIGYGQ